MIRFSTDDPDEEGLSYTSMFFGLVLIAIIGATFLPRMIKGVILGYEWRSETLAVPLRAPLVRPIYLNEGEVIQVNYSANIDHGRLEINAYYASQLTMLPFQSTKINITTLRASAEGVSDFKALQTGFYYFGVKLISVKKLNVACEKPSAGLLHVLLDKQTDCASYKMNYIIALRGR